MPRIRIVDEWLRYPGGPTTRWRSVMVVADVWGEQRVLINVDLYIPLAESTPVNDQLDEVVDYDFIRDTIAKLMARGHVQLQETLCDDIVRAMLAHPRVRAANVSTMKPDVYPDCEGVGVEVFQIKEQA